MQKVFLVTGATEITFEQLLFDINAKQSYSSYVYVDPKNPYEIFLCIVHSLIKGYHVTLVDGDLSDEELLELGLSREILLKQNQVKAKCHCADFQDVIKQIKSNSNWALTLYTSGTTGRPKKVTHDLQTLLRNVKTAARLQSNVWAFAYNPTHMAGLQVFLQAFFNHNTIVYAFSGQQKNLSRCIEKYKITNISATTTYYRAVLPYLGDKKYDSMKYITFGGEGYDASLEAPLHKVFPNAKIRNIYASTEAGSLFTANGDVFEIHESIRGFVKIVDNQLLIHCTLLGASDSYDLSGEWFHTGDIVEEIEAFKFRFVSRQSDVVNIGGYKVNPVEVENILLNVPGVLDLIVKATQNKVTGHILTADVVKVDDADATELKKLIKQYAKQHLQAWKIPRIITFVLEIPRSRSGKKVRK